MRSRPALALTLLLAGGLAAGSSARAVKIYGWSYDRLLQRIDGAPIAIAGTHYRVDREMVVCNGLGPAIRAGQQRRWRRFTCTQTILRPKPTDITFRVRVVDERRFRIESARYGP